MLELWLLIVYIFFISTASLVYILGFGWNIHRIPSFFYLSGIILYLVIGLPFFDVKDLHSDFVIDYFYLISFALIPVLLDLSIERFQMNRWRRQLVDIKITKVEAKSTIFVGLLALGYGLYLFEGVPLGKVILISTNLIGSSSSLVSERQEFSNTDVYRNLKFLVYFIFFNIALAVAYITSNRQINRFLGITIFLGLCITQLFFLHKDTFVFLCVIAYIICMREIKFSPRFLFTTLFIAFGTILSVYFFFSLRVDEFILKSMLNRISGVYIEITSFVLSHGTSDFVWGRTFINPGGIFSFEPFQFGSYIFSSVYGSHLNGYAPAPGLAEMYFNFGWFGVFFGSVFITLAILFLRYSLSISRFSLFTWVLWFFFAFGMNGVSRTSFFVLFDPKNLMVAGLFFGIVLLRFILTYGMNGNDVKSVLEKRNTSN